MRQGATEAKVRCDVLAGKPQGRDRGEVLPGRRDRAWHNGQRVPGTTGLLEVLPDDTFHARRPRARQGLAGGATGLPRRGARQVPPETRCRPSGPGPGAATSQRALCANSDGRLDSRRRRRSTSGTSGWPRSANAWPLRVRHWSRRSRPMPPRPSRFSPARPAASRCDTFVPGRALCDALATSVGGPSRGDDRRPQRDELEIEAGGLDARTRLSQGRQRCVALSLRLASHRLMTTVTGAAPVLLLDDAFQSWTRQRPGHLWGSCPTARRS